MCHISQYFCNNNKNNYRPKLSVQFLAVAIPLLVWRYVNCSILEGSSLLLLPFPLEEAPPLNLQKLCWASAVSSPSGGVGGATAEIEVLKFCLKT